MIDVIQQTLGEQWASLGHTALKVDGENSGTIYVGQAAVGSNGTAPAWQIKKVVDTGGTLTTVTWADGDLEYNNVWNNRGTLSYS